MKPANLKPDLGLHFKELFGEEVTEHFYSVLIFDIIHVGHNLYTFTSNATYKETEYAASFDFTTDKLKIIINSLQDKNFAMYLSTILLKPFSSAEKAEFRDNPVQADIVASLGQPVESLYETFIPFIIEEIENILL